MTVYRITVRAVSAPPRPYAKTMRLDSDESAETAAVNIWYRRRVRWQLRRNQCSCTLERFNEAQNEYVTIAKWGV